MQYRHIQLCTIDLGAEMKLFMGCVSGGLGSSRMTTVRFPWVVLFMIGCRSNFEIWDPKRQIFAILMSDYPCWALLGTFPFFLSKATCWTCMVVSQVPALVRTNKSQGVDQETHVWLFTPIQNFKRIQMFFSKSWIPKSQTAKFQ